jgi:urea carboxylase
MVLESMKMEIPVVAPCDGMITQLFLDSGNRVQAGQTLLVIQPEQA